MKNESIIVGRAKFLLALAAPNRGERIETARTSDRGRGRSRSRKYSPRIGRRLVKLTVPSCTSWAPRPKGKDIPMACAACLLPAFVKATATDHEQPIIGVRQRRAPDAWPPDHRWSNRLPAS